MKGKSIRKVLAALLSGTFILSMGMVSFAAEPGELFDADYYAQTNPDVVAAVGNSPEALYQHFMTNGMAEGRSGSAMFNLAQYKKNNPDLVRVFGDDNAAYYRHYVEHGMDEGRDAGAMFNPKEYAEAYPDVVAAVGDSPEALFHHFMTSGLAEGRTVGLHFNATCYAALNPDLARKYGTDEAALFREYVTEGAAEGRKGVYTDRAYKWYCDQKDEHTIDQWVVEYHTTCVDSGVQRGFCAICGEEETNVNPPDGYSHVNKNVDDRCDLCGARLNTHARK